MSVEYKYRRDALALLLSRTFFPERTTRESAVILQFLEAHGEEYDSYEFSVRVGVGTAADPSHLEGVQRSTVFSSKKRIDMLFRQGPQPFIIELKERVTPAALGQLLTYRELWMAENPDELPPILVCVGRYSDDDTVRVLQAHDVTVYLYDPPATGPGAPGGGLPPGNGSPA